MSIPLPSKSPWLSPESISDAAFQRLPLVTTAALAILVLISMTIFNKKSNYTLVNPPDRFQLSFFKQLDFIKNGREIFFQSKKIHSGKPFRMLTELGEVVVLPPAHAQMIRNEENLSFGKAVSKDFHAHIPGFEPFGIIDHDGQIAQAVVRKQLTKYLNTVTEPLSSEATFAMNLIFGESPEWKEVCIKENILDLIARLSSRVFLGDELCRNEDWLKITKQYTVDSFKAAIKMTVVPQAFKFFLRWFSHDFKTVRQEFNRAVDIINPVIERRRALKAKARAEGTPLPIFNDAIDWAESESHGQSYNPAVFQLVLSFAAIHTTTDLLCQTLLLLSNDPELITPLREEMVSVLKVEGWKKSALYNMKLLDSAIKEAQRIKPNGLLSMRRLAVKDIVLPDGTTIRKGERTQVDATNMHNPDIYSDPQKYDIYRFLRMREKPEYANKAQLVATSPDHLSFGHGMHACPGRFFAANEVKIALCHLLLKYDWKLAPGTSVKPIINGIMMNVNPANKLMFRRRKEEIDLESLEFN